MSHWREIFGVALALGLAAGVLFGGPNVAGAAEEAAKDTAAGASTAAALTLPVSSGRASGGRPI